HRHNVPHLSSARPVHVCSSVQALVHNAAFLHALTAQASPVNQQSNYSETSDSWPCWLLFFHSWHDLASRFQDFRPPHPAMPWAFHNQGKQSPAASVHHN